MSVSNKERTPNDNLETVERAGAGRIGFVPELESLRGVGALMVAAFHASASSTGGRYTLFTDPRGLTNPIWSALLWVDRYLPNPAGALNVFFVLSGFVLASSIERGPAGIGPAARHFFIGRIFRIYPAAISTILLFCVIFWTTGATIPGAMVQAYQPVNIIRNMLLIDWFINGVMWSLTVEALAIPLIFVVTIGQQRLGGKFTLLVAVLLLAPSIGRPYRYLIDHGGFVTFFYLFVVGIGTHRIGPRLIDWIGRRGLITWFIAAMLLLFFLPRSQLGDMSRWARFAECIAAAGLIAVLVYGPRPTRLSRVLNSPLFRFYGRISYSFYLLHPITLMVLWAIPAQLAGFLDAGVPAVLICLALTIISITAITPLSWLSWRFIEIPGIAAGRRLSPDRRNASPYVGPRGRVVVAGVADPGAKQIR